MRFSAFAYLLAVLSFVGLSACSSSDSGRELNDPPVDTTPPELVSGFPETESEDLDPTIEVRLEFSEELDPDSVFDGTLLNEGGGIVLFSGENNQNEGLIAEPRTPSIVLSLIPAIGSDLVTGEEIDIDASVATVTPVSGRFALNSTYTVEVNENLRDLADQSGTTRDESNYFSGETRIVFSIADGEWSTGDFINDAGTGNVFDTDLTGNAEGQIYGIWRQYVGGFSQIHVATYDSDSASWGSSTRLDDVDDASAFAPSININEDGLVVATWYQAAAAGQSSSIWVSRFESGAWTEAVNISAQDPDYAANSPVSGIGEDGSIFVLWRQEENIDDLDPGAGRYFELFSRRFDPVLEAWEPAESLSGSVLTDANTPALEVLSSGQFLSAWVQVDDSNDRLMSSRYRPSSGWSAPQRVDVSDSGNVSRPALAIDPRNDGFLAWEQSDGIRKNIWGARYAAGSWSQVQKMELDDRGPATKPQVSFDKDGNGFLVWIQDEGANDVVFVRRFEPDTGWLEAESLTSEANVDFLEPRIAFDYEGHAIAYWLRESASGSSQVWYGRFTKFDSWSDSAQIMTPGTLAASNKLVQIKQDGRMLGLWYDFDGINYRQVSALFSE